FAAALAARTDTRVVPGRTAEFLAAFPTSVLDLPELVEPLARLGVRTLGRLAELPADAVAGRFGAAGVAAHRLARGLDAQPPAPLRQGPDLSVAAEFAPAVDASEPIVFAAKALADELHEVLAQAGVACVRVAVEIHGAAGPGAEPAVSHRLWRHEGLLSSTAVAERVRWQLSGWQAKLQGQQDPDTKETHHTDQGVTRLRLIPDHLVPARGVQPGLWGADEAPDRIARVAERLQAMYGPNAVTLIADAGGRGPADQGVRTPYGDLPPAVPEPAPWPAALPAPAPADVPREPRPAEVTDHAGAPVGVSGRLRVRARPAELTLSETGERLGILTWAGPWPLTERWWEPEAAVRRARFQAVTDDGRAWLLIVRDGRWFVEAVYD
ncbi:DNA polymerase Y family protein, partial [Catenulispora pinisilvae]|uniref:DNA polymerase Y family protein n=1 Tax=Catenulispora pinisilvae TaxID=2705253 RepID=UPI00189279E0